MAIAILIVPVAALLAHLRLPAGTQATVYAEDGPLFLSQYEQFGPWGSIFQGYAGYLQFLPRLLTNLALAVAPLERYATTVDILVCLTTGVVAALVFVCSRDVVSSVAARLVLASVTVLAPLLPAEVLGNMANIHWLFLWLTPWILMYRPTRWWQSGVLAVIVLASALTEIQVVLFLPMVLLSIRRPRSWPVSAALIGGVVWQIVTTLGSPRQHGGAQLGIADIAKGYAQQVFLGSWFPSAARLGGAYEHFGWWPATVAGVPFVVVAVIIALRFRGRELVAPVVAAFGATAPWVAAIVVNSNPLFRWNSQNHFQLTNPGLLRYAVVPSMFLIALVVLFTDHLLAGGHFMALSRVATSAIGVGLLVVILAVQLVWFHIPQVHGQTGPNWSVGMDRARDVCDLGHVTATIPSSPMGWHVLLLCRFVDEH